MSYNEQMRDVLTKLPPELVKDTRALLGLAALAEIIEAQSMILGNIRAQLERIADAQEAAIDKAEDIEKAIDGVRQGVHDVSREIAYWANKGGK